MGMQERLSLLTSVVRLANSATLSYHARLKALLKLLVDVFHTQSASIYILDEDHRFLSQKISNFTTETVADCLIPPGEGAAGLCAQSGKSVRLGKGNLHPHESVTGLEDQILAIPIKMSNRTVGVLSLGVQATTFIEDEQVTMLQDFVMETGGLIADASLADSSIRRINNLTILSELGKILNAPTSPKYLLAAILQICHKHSASFCTMIRILPGHGLPPGVAKKVKAKARPWLPTLLEIEKDCSDRVLATGIPLLTTDLISEEDLPSSHICVPLGFENRVFGTITFFGKISPYGYSQNYDEEDRELFDSMAMLISNALEGAVNYERMMRVSDENQKKLKEISLLYRISTMMLSTTRLDKLIHLTLTSITSGAAPFFDRAMLFLINERSGFMQGMLGVTRDSAGGMMQPEALIDLAVAHWDLSEEEMAEQRGTEFNRKVRETRLPLDRSLNISSRAVFDKKLIFVPAVEREKNADASFGQKFEISSFASAPLLAKQQVVGLVLVDNGITLRPIKQDDLRFLQLICNQAGMAIENSTLYNRIEEAHRDLREAQERIIQGEKLAAIGEMAASIAHELKNPLVSIGGFAKRLEKRLNHESPEGKYADTIVREVSRMEKMLVDILSFSKKSTICFQDCDINEIVEDALSIISASLEENSIRVRQRLSPVNPVLTGDCQQLKQVFINIFFNAQEAMKKGGDLQVSTSELKFNGKKGVAIKITDTGGGIPLEILNNIFNPFFTTKESGTGLGLPIAHRIVANHGGKIEINNRIGIGAEFTVLLPLQP